MSSEEYQKALDYLSEIIPSECKTSFEAEKALLKKFWWVSPLQSEKIVKEWIRNKKKIETKL
jgi:hypothetical protein